MNSEYVKWFMNDDILYLNFFQEEILVSIIIDFYFYNYIFI